MNIFSKLTCIMLSLLVLAQPLMITVNAAESDSLLTEADSTESTQPSETEEATLPSAPVEDVETPSILPVSTSDIPLYFQTDYPDVPYGSGTVATNGSNIVALAMVAEYVTGVKMDPAALASKFQDAGENNNVRLEAASDSLGLSWTKAQNVHETFAALKEGKIAIALMNEKSIFSKGYHYIVLSGMNAEDKILVNDPYLPNYDRWQLKNALQNGFSEGDIICGYSAAWIYDGVAVHSSVSLESEEEPDTALTDSTDAAQDEIAGSESSESAVAASIEEAIPEAAEAEPAVTEAESGEETVPEETEAAEETIPQQVESTEETIPQEIEPTEEPSQADSAPETAAVQIPAVPQYYQSEQNSAMTALAMVASALKGKTYDAGDLVKNYSNRGSTDIEKLEAASTGFGLSWEKAENIDVLYSALSEGSLAIVLMREGSMFTDVWHFIVLTGLTEDGKILVQDPKKSNYEDPLLQDGFLHGFSKAEIAKGYSGGWVYHPITKSAAVDSGAVAKSVPATSYTEVPLYFQTDYPNDRFGYGSVATDGCSVTSLAMVASYLTGHEYLPNELASYFGGYGQNNIERLEYGSTQLQLPWYKAENIHYVMRALQEGDIAIVMVGPESLFTDSQHFIVLTGLTEDGKIMVNDSFAPNYDDWQLRYLFRTGFTESHILQGYSGAWIYDVDAMPEDPFIYTEEKVSVECRYPDIQLTWEEQQLLAKVIWVEARGESKEGQQAVAEVVYNRMSSSGFADTLKGVIYAQGQFRSVPFLEDATPSQAQYEALEDALAGPYVLPEDVYYFATSAYNDNVWGEIGGHIFCYAS